MLFGSFLFETILSGCILLSHNFDNQPSWELLQGPSITGRSLSSPTRLIMELSIVQDAWSFADLSLCSTCHHIFARYFGTDWRMITWSFPSPIQAIYCTAYTTWKLRLTGTTLPVEFTRMRRHFANGLGSSSSLLLNRIGWVSTIDNAGPVLNRLYKCRVYLPKLTIVLIIYFTDTLGQPIDQGQWLYL